MNLFTFPFYAEIEQQSRFSICQQVANALPAPQNRWLPFVLKLPVSGRGLDCIRIFRAQDDTRYKTVPSTAFSYNAFSDGKQDYIFYYGGIVTNLNMPCGDYYLEAQGYYSEVFSVVNNLDPYLRLEWKSDGGIYQTGFSNLLYLNAIIAEPTYKIDEEGEEDAEGNFVALRTRVEKTLKLDTVLLPEFLVDALAGIALHTTKQIGRYLEANTLKVTPTWNKKGCAATVEITFLDGAAAVSEGCGTDAAFMPIDLTGFVPASCDGTAAIWVNQEDTRCEQNDAGNTGWIEIRQLDTNAASGTYNQSRWVRYLFNTDVCPIPKPKLKSRAISDTVYRTNCNPDQIAGFVTYTVPEGQFEGYDQAVIDQQALDYFNANKAAYANANAVCEAGRRVRIDNYKKNTKTITVTVVRTDTVGDCLVGIFTQITGDNGTGADTIQVEDSILIPAGQTTASKSIAQRGYVIDQVEVVQITSVDPSDYIYKP